MTRALKMLRATLLGLCIVSAARAAVNVKATGAGVHRCALIEGCSFTTATAAFGDHTTVCAYTTSDGKDTHCLSPPFYTRRPPTEATCAAFVDSNGMATKMDEFLFARVDELGALACVAPETAAATRPGATAWAVVIVACSIALSI